MPTIAPVSSAAAPKSASHYKVYVAPNALTYHRLQQLYAAATGHIAAVKLPEAKKLSPATAQAEYHRAVLMFYANLLASPEARRRSIFNDLMVFLKDQRNPTGLAGPILTALNYFVHAGLLPQVKVCLYVARSQAFQADLTSNAAAPVVVLDTTTNRVGLSNSKALSQSSSLGFQQTTLASATSFGSNAATQGTGPFGSLGGLNITFGTEADGAVMGACLAGAAIVATLSAVVVGTGGTASTAGTAAPVAIPAAVSTFTGVLAAGTGFCVAVNAVSSQPSTSTSSTVTVIVVEGNSTNETVTVTPGAPDGGSGVTVTVKSNSTDTPQDGPDAGTTTTTVSNSTTTDAVEGTTPSTTATDNNTSTSTATPSSSTDATSTSATTSTDNSTPAAPTAPSDTTSTDASQVCTPVDPGPSYTPAGGFEAGDWDNSSSTAGSSLNYGGIPIHSDGTGDLDGTSSVGSGLGVAKPGGDPLDTASYGGETLNTSIFNIGNSDPGIGVAFVNATAVSGFGAAHLSQQLNTSVNASLVRSAVTSMLTSSMLTASTLN